MGAPRHNPMAQAASAGMIGAKNGNGVQLKINPSDLPKYTCRACGHDSFFPEIRLLQIPELLRFATKGADALQFQTWACVKCGESQSAEEMKIVQPDKKENPLIEVAKG